MYEYEKWLVPKDGVLVRDPVTKAPLPKQGMLKPWTGPCGRYWRRRVNCGDAIIGNPPVAKSEVETIGKETKSKRRK